MKDAFYFRHDYNSRNDERILKVRVKFNNAEGYGLFWMVVESMAEGDGGVDGQAIASLSLSYGVSCDRLQAFFDYCIEIGIFYNDNDRICSKRMVEHKEFRKQLSDAGKAGAKARHGHPNSVANGIPNAKERKGKERKEKESKEAKAPAQTQESFVLSLKTNPLYKHCDIDREVLKAQQWVSVNPGRKFTQRFFIAWLNRIEAPIISIKNKPQAAF